jgi:hypothetical protein
MTEIHPQRSNKFTTEIDDMNYSSFYYDQDGYPVRRADSEDINTVLERTFVSGGASDGQIATLKQYKLDSTKAMQYTFTYDDVSKPTKWTSIRMEAVDI